MAVNKTTRGRSAGDVPVEQVMHAGFVGCA